MNKKRGATHADWAISLGLFLIYILTMFMILQPGIQPIYKETQLLDNLENAITEDTQFVITKTPLIIETVDLSSSGVYQVRISSELPLEKDGNKAAIFSEDGVYEDNARIDSLTNTLKFEAFINIGINKFWVYEIIEPDKNGDEYNYDNFLNSGEKEISNSQNNFTFTFGAPETIKGLDWSKFTSEVLNFDGFSCSDGNSEEDYTILKNILSYPSNKEFIIQVIESSSPRYTLEDMQDICHIENPFEQTSVFTREWITYKLNKYGITEPIRIHVEIW
ncbi:MAG: hypothetical protein KKB39_02165 [Nanoarchaeota archaeon]|nr:hypothetical protein [Nanoarchaeota archaeon]